MDRVLLTILTSLVLGLFAVGPLTAADTKAKRRIPTAADFGKIKLHKTNRQGVTKILGRSLWSYSYLANKGTIPVQLPESWGSSSIRTRPRDRTKLEKLYVLKYKAKFPQDYYYVVLRLGKVYYTTGPVPDDETDPTTTQKQYGNPLSETNRALHGHRIVTVYVDWYKKRGFAFLRGDHKGKYTAKMRFKPM